MITSLLMWWARPGAGAGEVAVVELAAVAVAEGLPTGVGGESASASSVLVVRWRDP